MPQYKRRPFTIGNLQTVLDPAANRILVRTKGASSLINAIRSMQFDKARVGTLPRRGQLSALINQATYRRHLNKPPSAKLNTFQPPIAYHGVDCRAAQAERFDRVVYRYCKLFHFICPLRTPAIVTGCTQYVAANTDGRPEMGKNAFIII